MNEYKATYTDLFTEHADPNNQSQGKITLRTDKFDLGTYHIMNWHSFEDMGASLETVQVWNPITKRLFEIYSSDEGETFTFGQPEPCLA